MFKQRVLFLLHYSSGSIYKVEILAIVHGLECIFQCGNIYTYILKLHSIHNQFKDDLWLFKRVFKVSLINFS